MAYHVSLVVSEGFQHLEVAGVADVFASANLCSPEADYRLSVVGVRRGEVTAWNGITHRAQRSFADAGPVDTMIVIGRMPSIPLPEHDEVVSGIAELSRRATRVASVCTGAFFLAEAGLLAGRRATTHWMWADAFAAQFPDVTVEADAIYVVDPAEPPVWTSAGVTAGIDLALAMVAADHGAEAARQVASLLVVYLQRPGGQSQFSTAALNGLPRRERFRELQAFIDANPGADLSVPTLARRVAMSERHFTRVFTEEVGIAPGKYVGRSRAEAARRLLETTDQSLGWVAESCGLGTAETLYRMFTRHWGVAPSDYRRRFRPFADRLAGA